MTTQDVWLKMHSAEGFAHAQGGGDITQLLMLYRSASLEVIEGMMRYPELEKVADGYTRKKVREVLSIYLHVEDYFVFERNVPAPRPFPFRIPHHSNYCYRGHSTNDIHDPKQTQGDGMRSYRETVAQDADFADATEAAAWLGFSTRRNPLFLPPRAAAANAKKTPSSAADIDSDLLARLRDAQDFILLDKKPSSPSTSEGPADRVGGTLTAVDMSGSTLPGEGSVGGGPRRPTIRDRVRAMNSQLARSQEQIRELEDTLGSLEAGRDSDRERAARARAAAAEAGRRKLTQKMYRLRGNAAFLEEGLAELDGEITAVRVRLFAERLVSAAPPPGPDSCAGNGLCQEMQQNSTVFSQRSFRILTCRAILSLREHALSRAGLGWAVTTLA